MDVNKEKQKGKKLVARLTSKNQLTVQVEVRRLLGLPPRGKVEFIIAGGEVRLTPAGLTLDETYGAVKPMNRPENFQEMERAVREERAKLVLDEMRKP